MNKKILCIGELLWDSLPSGLFIGGAPFNVACHLKMLDFTSCVVSRIGKDILGEIALTRVREKGISTDFIQLDDTIPTGIVHAKLDSKGNATYDIVEPSAWDFIEAEDSLNNAIGDYDAVVFGSLAQRNNISASSIHKILDKGKLNIFDVNLRPPFDNAEVVKKSLYKSSIVKLNDNELFKIAGWFGFDEDLQKAAEAVAKKFGCSIVCVTMGDKGAILFKDKQIFSHPGYRIKVADTVGAGDAFLAALINAYAEGKAGNDILEEANLLGAFVASMTGAIPAIDKYELNRIKTSQEAK